MSIFNLGDHVVLRYDDQPENDEIVGKVSVVVALPQEYSPHWMLVERDGKIYSVRGGDCSPAAIYRKIRSSLDNP